NSGRPAVGIRDLAAAGSDNGVAGGNIPFRGRRQAWVNVDGSLGDPAELDRRAQRLANRAGSAGNEGLGPFVSMRTADRGNPWLALSRPRSGVGRVRCSPP